jgi:hypothetical protein
LQWVLENGGQWNRHLYAWETWPQNVLDWLQENELLDA